VWQEIEREGEARGEEWGVATRFGPLPDWADEKLKAASIDVLDLWLRCALSADTLGVVFELPGDLVAEGSHPVKGFCLWSDDEGHHAAVAQQ
jgi:hypothetical protein